MQTQSERSARFFKRVTKITVGSIVAIFFLNAHPVDTWQLDDELTGVSDLLPTDDGFSKNKGIEVKTVKVTDDSKSDDYDGDKGDGKFFGSGSDASMQGSLADDGKNMQ